jgi:hypothetical protein
MRRFIKIRPTVHELKYALGGATDTAFLICIPFMHAAQKKIPGSNLGYNKINA